jgi:hypothetical protein
LRAINAVLVTLKINGCSLAILPALIESAPNKELLLPVLVRD